MLAPDALDSVHPDTMIISSGSSSGFVSQHDSPSRRPRLVDLSQVKIDPEPSRILLMQLAGMDEKLKHPLFLFVEHDEVGSVVVSDQIVHAYGVGTSEEEAIEDYESMLLDLYESLMADADRLSPRLRRQLQRLNLILG